LNILNLAEDIFCVLSVGLMIADVAVYAAFMRIKPKIAADMLSE
jgi:hypothetical protein